MWTSGTLWGSPWGELLLGLLNLLMFCCSQTWKLTPRWNCWARLAWSGDRVKRGSAGRSSEGGARGTAGLPSRLTAAGEQLAKG